MRGLLGHVRRRAGGPGAAPALERKPESYYAQQRADLVARLPRPLGRVLDVGCGGGGAAAPLRRAGAAHITGIELDEAAAEAARARYDRVLRGPVEELLADLAGPFDTILCYDVLEHLVDPWGVLRALRGRAAPGGSLHVSVPNARHHSLLRDLALRGTFGYAEWGHRDITHLRWFTRRDLAAALSGAGWTLVGIGHDPLVPASRLVARLTRGLSADFLVYQWQALARAV
ncbi:MAG: hypothetical protein QOK40_240 [Miltoncostaeaceae bacterium]|nr:hypothetical protein [Miltoncostaeaceae bacterium]